MALWPENEDRAVKAEEIQQAVATTLQRVLALVLPPQCLLCAEPLAADEEGGLCASCWPRLHFLTPPDCAVCGVPFSPEALAPSREAQSAQRLGLSSVGASMGALSLPTSSLPASLPTLPVAAPSAMGTGAATGACSGAAQPAMICGSCLAQPPVFARARAVLSYDETARPLVTRFKYGDGTEAAPVFARWMARAGKRLLEEADVLVPVPLHRLRLLSRRYNQAGLLARALARETHLPVRLTGLERHKRTVQQVGLSNKGRRRNVANAFRVPPAELPHLAGKRVVLIDDVFTTGATVEACARTLLRAGAIHVDVLTLARVVTPSQPG